MGRFDREIQALEREAERMLTPESAATKAEVMMSLASSKLAQARHPEWYRRSARRRFAVGARVAVRGVAGVGAIVGGPRERPIGSRGRPRKEWLVDFSGVPNWFGQDVLVLA